MQIYPSFSAAHKNPHLIKLRNNFYVLSFQVMKLLPALNMINQALKSKLITPETVVVETSSGSFAYGVGVACSELGLKFKIVSDLQMDPLIERQLINQGGDVAIVTEYSEIGGIQQARLNRLFEIMKKEKKSFWTCQYDNQDNSLAYFDLGVELSETLGDDIILVGPVGSGGSTCGLISGFRNKTDCAMLVGVDTFNSILFGQKDGPRVLPGLGNSIMPKNLNHNKFDQVHWVTAAIAFQASLELHTKYGLFAGPTTGAAYPVSNWLAEQYPNKKIILISPDTGHRYINSLYNPLWLETNGYERSSKYLIPAETQHPQETVREWSYIKWKRRTLQEVLK